MLTLFPDGVDAGCGLFWSPYWTAKPKVERIGDGTGATVDWSGIVRNRDCVDQYYIKVREVDTTDLLNDDKEAAAIFKDNAPNIDSWEGWGRSQKLLSTKTDFIQAS